MLKIKLKDLKKGDFFTLKDYGDCPNESQVYIKGDYERIEKKYSCIKFSDCNSEIFKKGDMLVYTDFIF